MFAVMLRELRYLKRHKVDLFMAVIAPLLVILLFGSMFSSGKAEHLPIVVIDQDQSEMSRKVIHALSINHTLKIKTITSSQDEAEKLINTTDAWGFVMIPEGAEQRLVQAQDAQISIAYNQSFFSIGNTISSAMLISTLNGMAEYLGQSYLANTLPYLDVPTPHIKISTLYNPSMSYELFLEPFMVPAVLHLLLCCCVAFAIGQEFKRKTVYEWVNSKQVISSLLGKILPYVFIFCAWTACWMFWLAHVHGYFIAGSLTLILAAQFLFYFSYAVISSTVVLATKNLPKTFGFIALYGGSSPSFSGITLPLNNAPAFTQFWSMIIPYTPYAKLQTEQWIIGSDLYISLIPFSILVIFSILFFALSIRLLKKNVQEIHP
ncbi:ABC transporter permease [Acinetobacter venetianus]|uniref:ABC-2 family transporter protein n=1 Tax=Acinetobacter venetianus TaxID=52133 RepID=A0A150HXE9_9GAMM|nr:ABC transporter permease [Acinetobacter venetianus]KXZ71406.1 ABC-2 family transporter protein [Acinetobacter venetianus]